MWLIFRAWITLVGFDLRGAAFLEGFFSLVGALSIAISLGLRSNIRCTALSPANVLPRGAIAVVSQSNLTI
jgi:hypothetical protein